MSTPNDPDDDLFDDLQEEEDDEEESVAGARCPVCEMLAGECDHLVASIDLTYSEFIAGAIFAQERTVLDLVEHLAAADPDRLKAAGAGPVLEHVATLVKAEIEEGASPGDAVSIHYPYVMAALSHLLQEDEQVTMTGTGADADDDSAVENLWAREPETIVEQLIERLQGFVDEVDENRDEGPE